MKSLFLLLFLAPALSQAAMNLEEFRERMKKHVASLSGKTTASVRIEVLGKGTELFSHNDSGQLIPASNVKLITTIAAIDKLGAGYRFNTKVIRKGEDLVLMGNGDPYLVSERLYLIARDVARAGIKKVNTIRVNNSAYGENYKGLMDWDNSGEPFTAMVSPTSLNFNSIEVHVSPAGAGGKPKVELGPVPHGYATVRNEAKVVSGSRRDLSVSPVKQDGNKEVFVLRGTIGRDAAPAIVYASVSQPESHIAHAFAALLRKEGVEVAKEYGGASFAPENGGEVISSQDGFTLMELVRLLNTYSNNFMTEQIFQAYGAAEKGGAASLGKAQQSITGFVKQQEACKSSVIENGSGLSWNSRVSADCFIKTIQSSYRDFRAFADLLGSLPVGGQTGTLRSRFRKTGSGFDAQKVRAKTGTLWSRQVVTSLVGFTQTASGEAVVFALIENDQRNDPGQLSVLKDWEDKCVEYIQQLRL
jgi:D-alanyl-D-alanine carboxypeptidase/D-alanyl-D-alanine-endopeptidase (penicillin-binding protein 4)